MEKMTCNGRDFDIVRLLGKGKGGYSYLVTAGGKQYVLKQIHHEPCGYYTFGDKLQSELQDYKTLKDLGIPMPELLDADCEQERILKTFIDGDTVNVLVKEDRMEPSYYDQIQSICHKLYAANLNIDYYPTNFVVQQGKLFYIDFECNGYMEQWNFENWGCRYWHRTPEFAEAFP